MPVVAFWVTMKVLLWRMEYDSARKLGVAEETVDRSESPRRQTAGGSDAG